MTVKHQECLNFLVIVSVLIIYLLHFCHFRIKIELHFSLIAAAVTYIMWKHVGNDKIPKVEGKRKKIHDREDGFDSDGTLVNPFTKPSKILQFR